MDPDVQFYSSHAVILSFILTKFNRTPPDPAVRPMPPGSRSAVCVPTAAAYNSERNGEVLRSAAAPIPSPHFLAMQ